MRFGIIANPSKYAVRAPLAHLYQWAGATQHDIMIADTLVGALPELNSARVLATETDVIDASDIVLAIGGDGTMLHTAGLVGRSGKPILGINSGRLGFLATLQEDQVHNAMSALVEGRFQLEQRSLLTATDAEGKEYHALNEFLFSKMGTPAMITVNAWYDGFFINRYWADGLIIATPTGSTAYNLASNGPIVSPQADVMILTPICPHTLTIRPLVLPNNKELKIQVVSQPHEVLFSYDGQVYEIAEYPFEMHIKRSDYSVNMIQLSGHNYFDTLRTKLMWGKDYREVP